MKVKIIILILLVLVALTGQGKELYSNNQAEKAVQRALKDKGITFLNTIPITQQQEVKKEPVSAYLFSNQSGEKFYAIITCARGRYDLFDYLLVVSLNHEVELVKVLKYRSEHGGEIASKKWLEQFKGYSSGTLRYRQDISAISGATLSAKAITEDVQLVMRILDKNIK
jgi:Na+-translocating ferredoxin:NAD+ oxidoreductase RnfG subunit